MTEEATNAAVTAQLRALAQEEAEKILGAIQILDTPEAQQYIAALVRPQIEAAVTMFHGWLQLRLFADPTPPLWANVTIVYPPLPHETPDP
jgi:hypothetical protein